MNTSISRGMRPFAGNEGRYAAVDGTGRRLWVRDQVTLRADIVELLRRDGALPKKRIITALGASQAAIETALAALLDDGRIERYKARSLRGRMDEHWRLKEQSPVRHRFDLRSAAILAAFQSAAAARYSINLEGS